MFWPTVKWRSCPPRPTSWPSRVPDLGEARGRGRRTRAAAARRSRSGRRRWPLMLTSSAASSRRSCSSSRVIPSTARAAAAPRASPNARDSARWKRDAGSPPSCSSLDEARRRSRAARDPRPSSCRTQRLPPWRCLLASAPADDHRGHASHSPATRLEPAGTAPGRSRSGPRPARVASAASAAAVIGQ